MSNKNHVCPFSKTTCIGCSLYRGRHMSIWQSQTRVNKPELLSEGDKSDWIVSLTAFFNTMSDR